MFLSKKIMNLSFNGLLILFSLFFFTSCGNMVTIKGKVFIEDENVIAAWTNDTWLDYQERDVQATIRSGNITVTTDNDGYFELEGVATVGDLLLEFSMEGYQTNYMDVAFSRDIEGENVVEQKGGSARDRIVFKNGTRGVRFYDTSGGLNKQLETFISTEGRTYDVSVYLLKEPDDQGNWDVFRYTR